MLIRTSVLAVQLLAVAITSAIPAHADPYAYATINNGQFGILNLKTGEIALCGSERTNLVGLALDPEKVLYGADANGDIYTVDPTSGAETFVGYADGIEIANFGYSTNGMYAVAGQNSLYSISGTNGKATLIGPMSFIYQGDSIAEDGENLYVSNGKTLYEVDTQTAAGQVIGITKDGLSAIVTANHRIYGVHTSFYGKRRFKTRLYVISTKNGHSKFETFIDATLIRGLAKIPSGASNSCN